MGPPPRPASSHQGQDMTLTLPPIQTSSDQSRSVEAMVMSINFMNKIRVLGKIAPPLRNPGPTSPTHAVRGALVAIEGDDTPVVKGLAVWLENFLNRSGEASARVESGPRTPSADVSSVGFRDYLDVVHTWHGKSKDIIEYITSPPPNKEEQKEEPNGESMASPMLPVKPVCIIPTFQLHAADVFASHVPIQDAYSPADHWQWMATLWRGIVGPDVTIYVSDVSREELAKEKLVEVKEEVKVVIVRKLKGSEKIDESALRRVGFELGEWIRTVGAVREDAGH